jgi:putative endonuclease
LKARDNSIGARAEQLAADHLSRQGLVIVERNFRTRHGEIDLVARDGNSLVFVEVRMRSRGDFGGAAGSVTAAKRARWIAAAQGYLAKIGASPRAGSTLCCSTPSTRRVWSGCATWSKSEL